MDHINAEIVTRSIQSKQDAVDYLTWTFFYRRLAKNPNYYNLQGASKAHLSDFLSELVENTLQDLEAANCIAVDDMDVSALNLGMISSYYDVTYTSIGECAANRLWNSYWRTEFFVCWFVRAELFATSLHAKVKTKGLLEILSNSTEFGRMIVRHHEGKMLESLAKHVPVAMPATMKRFSDVAIKANVLMQCHFSRRPLTSELKYGFAHMCVCSCG